MAFKVKAGNGQIRTWSATALASHLSIEIHKARQLKSGKPITISDTAKLSMPKALYKALIITKAKKKESTDG